MAKNTASVSQTGGVGYGFEKRVAAWFMAHLLSRRLPLDAKFGLVVSVDFQVRESGWLLDDLLITGKHGDEPSRRLAISVKRNRQVTGKGFPVSFVEDLWEQWLGTHSNTFVHGQDLLCPVVGKLADTVKEAWDELLIQALDTAPERIATRFSSPGHSSDIQRKLFASLHCPPPLSSKEIPQMKKLPLNY